MHTCVKGQTRNLFITSFPLPQKPIVRGFLWHVSIQCTCRFWCFDFNEFPAFQIIKTKFKNVFFSRLSKWLSLCCDRIVVNSRNDCALVLFLLLVPMQFHSITTQLIIRWLILFAFVKFCFHLFLHSVVVFVDCVFMESQTMTKKTLNSSYSSRMLSIYHKGDANCLQKGKRVWFVIDPWQEWIFAYFHFVQMTKNKRQWEWCDVYFHLFHFVVFSWSKATRREEERKNITENSIKPLSHKLYLNVGRAHELNRELNNVLLQNKITLLNIWSKWFYASQFCVCALVIE